VEYENDAFGSTLFDNNDFARHIDYVHWNPMKHSLVQKASDCPYSSFQRYVKQGFYPIDWAGGS